MTILELSVLSVFAHLFARTLNHLRKSLPLLLGDLSLRKHVLHFCLALSASLIPLLTRVNSEYKALWAGCLMWWQLQCQRRLHFSNKCNMCSFLCVCIGRHKHVYHLQRTESQPTATLTSHPLSTFTTMAPPLWYENMPYSNAS